MQHLNVEIKARCSDQDRVRAYLKEHNAAFKGIDHQVDTYFKVPNGRLKLREGNIENYLIYYTRTNQAGPKQSDITLYEVAPGASLKDILTLSLGILAVVDKQREIYFINNVKFHVDTVQGLGTFMEIEAIDSDGSHTKEMLHEQCNRYMRELNIHDVDLLSDSYSDHILRKTSE